MFKKYVNNVEFNSLRTRWIYLTRPEDGPIGAGTYRGYWKVLKPITFLCEGGH